MPYTYQEMLGFVRDARRGFEQEISKLYVHDVPLYDEETMQKIKSTLRSQRNEALRAIERDTQAYRDELVRSAELSDEFASDEVLSTSEQAEAERRAPTIEREISGMDNAQIAARLEGILKHGSKVDKYLYYSFASKRNREDKRRRAAEVPRGQGRSVDATLSQLDLPLSQLDKDLYEEERERRRSRISWDLEQCDEILKAAYLARHEAKSVGGAYAKQHYHDFSELARRQRRGEFAPTGYAGGGRIANDSGASRGRSNERR